MADHYDTLETRDPQLRERAQLEALATQIAYAKRATAAYASRLADVDASAVNSRAALARLPLTRKSELVELQKSARPFGGLAASGWGKAKRVFASPGPVYEPEGAQADYWRLARALYAAGFRAGDLVHNCFSYHFTPAGSMLESGAHALGCTVFPGGVGQTEQQLQAMQDLQPDGYIGTPSFLKIILDKADELSVRIASLRKALVSGEPFPAALRDALAARGIAGYQVYATADVGAIAYESEARDGLIVDEGVLLEIVRPGTGDPVSAGEVGEVVVTPLNNRDYPVLRFATGDLSAILPTSLTMPSPCGRTNLRIKGWMGRADQTTKVRGMFVHPAQIAALLQRHPEILKARLIVDNPDGADRMTLQVEARPGQSPNAEVIVATMRELTKLRATVVRASGELPNDGKVIDDVRKLD